MIAPKRAIPLEEVIAKLPEEEQRAIAEETERLVAEELALRQIRKARAMTQQRVAELLGIGQDGVSRLENRSDLLLSTLRGYIEALGGRLHLVAEFPDRPAIRLKGFGEPDFEDSLEDGDIPATPEPSAASNT